ncbi:MAG: hypothetical protein ACK44B_05745, partial [Flavobacteriales bacterium]
AFGTTLKKAGSQAKQWEIDVDIPTNIMKLAKESGIENCVLVSALGVSKKSPFFYSKMKAQLDDNAESMGFKKLILVKPSVLEGPRVEKRVMEEWTITIGNLIGKTGLINKYKPVEAINVAKAMIQGLIDLPDGTHEISSDEIHEYAKRYTEDEFRKEIGQN